MVRGVRGEAESPHYVVCRVCVKCPLKDRRRQQIVCEKIRVQFLRVPIGGEFLYFFGFRIDRKERKERVVVFVVVFQYDVS